MRDGAERIERPAHPADILGGGPWRELINVVAILATTPLSRGPIYVYGTYAKARYRFLTLPFDAPGMLWVAEQHDDAECKDE